MGIQFDGINNEIKSQTKIDFPGSIGIAGTLTYEDVANVDSIGIITARTGVIVGSGVTLNATGVIATGVITATSFVGSGANLTGITQTTINSNADNRVITGSGTANTLNAETNVVVDSSGRLLVGTAHNASRNVGDLTAKIQLEGSGYNQSSLSLMSNAGASAGNTPHFTLGKSRGSSNGDNTVIADDDALGQIQFAGADGTDCNSVAASIIGRVDGAPGSNDMPGRLVFSTTDDGAAAPTERVQIKSGGGLVSSKGGSLPFSDGYSALEARAPAGTTQLTVTNTTYESGSYDNEAGIWFKGNYSGNNERAKSAIIHKNTGDYGVGDLYFCIDDSGDNNNASVNDVRFRINKDGKSGFGAPFSTYSDPFRLYLRYFYDGGAGYANGLVIDSRPDVLTTKHIRFYYALHGSGGGSELGSVTSSNAGSVSYNTSSDYRRKQNDVAITDGIAKVKSLRPIRFNWIEQPEITEDGFFAHEAQEVVPNSVFGKKDAVDKDGKPDYQVMDHSKLVPLLTAALKDAIAKIETLETKVAALEGS